MFASGRSNSDESWNRFKLVILQPLSERIVEEFLLDDYGGEEAQLVNEESTRVLNSATERCVATSYILGLYRNNAVLLAVQVLSNGRVLCCSNQPYQ